MRPQAFEFRRFDTAELMHRIPLGEQHAAAHGAPYFHIHRPDLHALLVVRVRSLDPVRAAFQKKDLAKSRAGWLYSHDPLTVPLPA